LPFDRLRQGRTSDIVAATGAAVAILVLLGTVAAFAAKLRTWQDFKSSGYPKEEFWVRTRITYVGFATEAALPLVFGIAWALLEERMGWRDRGPGRQSDVFGRFLQAEDRRPRMPVRSRSVQL
jgi:hypothetical protein